MTSFFADVEWFKVERLAKNHPFSKQGKVWQVIWKTENKLSEVTYCTDSELSEMLIAVGDCLEGGE